MKCKKQTKKKPHNDKVHKVEEDSSSSETEEEWVNMLSTGKSTTGKSKSIKCRLQVGPDRKPLTFQVDTGASVNILPECYAPSITATHKKLTMWNNTDVNPLGTCRTTVRNPANRKKYSVEFVVVSDDCNFVPLIGCATAEAMKFVSVNNDNFDRVASLTISDDYSDVFSEGLGTFPGVHHLKVNPDATPVIMPNHRIPQSVRPALKTELDRLCKLKVIATYFFPSC